MSKDPSFLSSRASPLFTRNSPLENSMKNLRLSPLTIQSSPSPAPTRKWVRNPLVSELSSLSSNNDSHSTQDQQKNIQQSSNRPFPPPPPQLLTPPCTNDWPLSSRWYKNPMRSQRPLSANCHRQPLQFNLQQESLSSNLPFHIASPPSRSIEKSPENSPTNTSVLSTGSLFSSPYNSSSINNRADSPHWQPTFQEDILFSPLSVPGSFSLPSPPMPLSPLSQCDNPPSLKLSSSQSLPHQSNPETNSLVSPLPKKSVFKAFSPDIRTDPSLK